MVPTSTEARIIGMYPDILRNPGDVRFLHQHLQDGCTVRELSKQIGIVKVTLVGLITRGHIAAGKELRVCRKDGGKWLTWAIEPIEIARVITVYRYHIQLSGIAHRHKKVIGYNTLRKYWCAGLLGRKLRTLTEGEAIHLDDTRWIVEKYATIRDLHLPENRDKLRSLKNDELANDDFANLFPNAQVSTVQNRARKDKIPHEMRRGRSIYKWSDIRSYLMRVISRKVRAGSRINPDSARDILDRFPDGYNRTSPEPSK